MKPNLTMTKRLASILLSLAMIICIMPTFAFADDMPEEQIGDSIEVTEEITDDAPTATLADEDFGYELVAYKNMSDGDPIDSGDLATENIICEKGKITLAGVKVTDINIYPDRDIEIVLVGENLIGGPENGRNGLSIYNYNTENIDAVITGAGSLDTYGYRGIYSTKADLNIKGGTIKASSEVEDGYGIYVYNSKINITGGVVNAEAAKAISAENGKITISGGKVTVEGKWGINSLFGDIDISGGEVSVDPSGKDIYGIFAKGGNLNISGGTVEVNINPSDGDGYGLFSQSGTINISDGTISVKMINTSNNTFGLRSDRSFIISGGKVSADVSSVTYSCGIWGAATEDEGDVLDITGGDIEIKCSGPSADGIWFPSTGNTGINGDSLKVTVQGENECNGIYTCGDLDINCMNLDVKAVDGSSGSAIASEGKVFFNGGTATATGIDYAVSSKMASGIVLDDSLAEIHNYKVEGDLDSDFHSSFVTDEKGTIATSVKIALKSSPEDSTKTTITSSADSFRAVASGKTAIQLAWPVVGDADRFVVYGAVCGKKSQLQKIAEITDASNLLVTNINGAELKKNTAYKFCIEAYREGQLLDSSYEVHAYTTGYKGKYGNVTSISSKTKNVKVKAGKKAKKSVKIKTKRVKGKKMMPKSHGPQLRYVSSNPAVATVTKKGKVKGVSSGNATIYTYSINGLFCTTSVIVE